MGWHSGEAARKHVFEALERLTDDLKAGNGEKLTDYLAAISRLRGHSWDNVFLISAQRRNATHIEGHHGWNDFGRRVRTDEKPILIFSAPDRDLFRTSGARLRYVFDISQTEGEPLLERGADHDNKERLGRLDAILARRDVNDRSVAEGVAYVTARALGAERGNDPAAAMMPHAGNRTAFAQRLAAIQVLSRQVLDELLPEVRPENVNGAARPTLKLDERSFAQLYREYRERLVNGLIGLARNRNDAEEIAARAFEIAWEKRESFRGNAAPSTWIEAIARHEARTFYRPVPRSLDSLDAEEIAQLAAADRVTDDLEKSDDYGRLGTAVARLPDKQRRVIAAHFLDGLSVGEIAAREDMPVGTVLSRIHQGKQQLRDALVARRPAQSTMEQSTGPTIDGAEFPCNIVR